MKRLISIINLLVLPIVASTSALADSGGASPAETMVKTFYKIYLHDLNAESAGKPVPKLSAYGTYVSSKILKHLQKLEEESAKTHEVPDDPDADTDYFIKAQDYAKEWEKNISVKALSSSKDKYIFAVVLSGGPQGMETDKLKVTVTQEAGEPWKIAKVESESK